MSDDSDRDRELLGGITERVEKRKRDDQWTSDEIGDETFDLFEDHDFNDLDDVWDQLDVKLVDDVESVMQSNVEVSIVDKRRYCQRCQYFSNPPSTMCEYDGSSIDAVVDSAHFRVAACPVVSGQAQLSGK